MSVKYSELTKHIKALEKKLSKRAYHEFLTDTTNKIAAELQRKVQTATPVGESDVKRGHKGGNLRRGWFTTAAQVEGNVCRAEVRNDVEYSIYVEYGHRQTYAWGHELKVPHWVEGQFFMTDTVEEFAPVVPAMAQRCVDLFMEELNG